MSRTATVTPADKSVLYVSGRWHVLSSRVAGLRYEVRQEARGVWSCQCPASAYGARCWHVRAVRRAAARRVWAYAHMTDAEMVRSGLSGFTYPMLDTDCELCATPLIRFDEPASSLRAARAWEKCPHRDCRYRRLIEAEPVAVEAAA